MPKLLIGDQEVDINNGAEGAEFPVGEGTVKVDDQGRIIFAEAYGNVIEKVEGGVLITRENGAQFLMGQDGSYTMMTIPKSVGIRHFKSCQLHNQC